MPDLRGIFLRGQGGNSSDLGIKQGDAIRNIEGYFNAYPSSEGPSKAFFVDHDYGGFHRAYGSSYMGSVMYGFSASRVVPTAEENRPVNMAVRYLLRARP